MSVGTNASAERVFSEIKAMWTQERSELSLQRVASMALIKFNTKQSCIEFYNSIKENRPVLEAIKSGGKYNLAKISSSQNTPLRLDAESDGICEHSV